MNIDLPQSSRNKILLRAVGLSMSYRQGGSLARDRRQVQALKDVDLQVQSGSTLALIGASGAGKSTLARFLACLEKPDSGEIWFEERNLATLDRRELISQRRKIQMVFQEPAASLNPRFTAVEIVSEPLLIAGQDKTQRRRKAMELIELV